MAIRKHPSKPGYWQIIISQGAKGKQLVFPFQCDEAEARRLDQQLNNQIKGRTPSVYPTIQEALPQYLEYYTTIATPRIVADLLSIMRRELLPAFGKLRPHQIAPVMVYSYTAKRLKDHVTPTRTVSHRTVEKELNHLRAMCRWLNLNGMAEKMPAIPGPPKAKTRPKTVQQPLTLNELSALLSAVPADKRVLLLLMSDAGLRREEALGLLVAEVDLPGERLTVRGKGGKTIVYPILTQRLNTALQDAVSRSTGQEFLTINPKTGKPYESLKTLLRLATARAGITKRVTHHTLRHTFSALLQEAGISTEVRRLLMRHSSLAATEHYTHISPGFLRSQSGNFGAMIDKTP